MSSLKFWDFENIKYRECCMIWLEAGNDTVPVHKVNIQAKLVSGIYILQSNKAKFNQYKPIVR